MIGRNLKKLISATNDNLPLNLMDLVINGDTILEDYKSLEV